MTTKKKPKISNEQAFAEAQVIQMSQMIKELFYSLLNAHIELKSLRPDVLYGSVQDYEGLKFYGLCPLSDKQKQAILDKTILEFPNAEEDWVVEYCQIKAYNKYLHDMAEFEMRITSQGVPADKKADVTEKTFWEM